MLFDGDDPWPEVAFVRELAAPHNRYVAARVDDKLVGYAGIVAAGPKSARSSTKSTPSVSIPPTRARASAGG